MNLSLPSVETAREVFEALRRDFGFSYRSEGLDWVLELPESAGRGCVRSVGIRDGLELTVVDCTFRESFRLEVSSRTPFLEVNLYLSGRSRGRVEGIKDEFAMSPGEGALFSGPEATRGMMECPPRRRILLAEVAFSPPMLPHLLKGGVEDPRLAALADGSREETAMRISKTTRLSALTLGQMMDCSYDDTTRRIYLEAKAMELLALQLAQPPVEKGTLDGLTLRLDDIERIHEAKEVLASDLEDPPSLIELSRRVGLNDFKLKAGFKQVFGTTAFGYLHEQRMERARHLIEGGGMNIGEVALAVGYSSPSRFAAAFKKRFGVRPSSLLSHTNGCRKALAWHRGG